MELLPKIRAKSSALEIEEIAMVLSRRNIERKEEAEKSAAERDRREEELTVRMITLKEERARLENERGQLGVEKEAILAAKATIEEESIELKEKIALVEEETRRMEVEKQQIEGKIEEGKKTKEDVSEDNEVAQIMDALQEARKRLEEETERTTFLEAQIEELEVQMTSAQSEAKNLRDEKGELTLGRLN